MIYIKPKIFVKTFIILTIAILTLIASINFIVNPLGKYPSKYFEPLIWTSRAEKTSLLSQVKYNPKVIILGSSRSMKLSPKFIEERLGLKTFNACVDSARAEDYYTMLMYILNETDIKPKAIFIGIDIEAFHNNLQPDKRLLNHSILSKYLDDNSAYKNRYSDLISIQQTKLSLQSILYYFKGYPEKTSSFNDDGFLHYLVWEKEKKEGTLQLEENIKNSISSYLVRFSGYSDTEAKRLNYFREFLQLSYQNDIKVIGFITTLHDEVLKELINKRDYHKLKNNLLGHLTDIESEFNNFKFVDFDNVHVYGGTLKDFYDGAHIAEENSNKISEKLIEIYINCL